MAQAKFDIRNEATRQFYAGVGVTDRAVELVRDYVADMQKRFVELQKSIADLDLEPEHLRKQATTRFEALNKDAIARRKAVEKRVAELQDEAMALPAKMQKLVDDNLTSVSKTMDDLAKRGESLVGRIRRQSSTQETIKEAKVTVTKAEAGDRLSPVVCWPGVTTLLLPEPGSVPPVVPSPRYGSTSTIRRPRRLVLPVFV